MALTKERIWEAADRLQEQGRQPTLAALREAVGGSYSTLAPALREWKARQAQRPEAAAESVPAAVQRLAGEAGKSIWATAARLAAERLAGERSALQQQRRASAEELAEAAGLADQLAGELKRERQRRRQLAARCAEAEARLAAVRAEAREDLEQARRRELAAREEAAALRGEVAAHRERNDQLLARLPRPPAAD